MLRLFIVIIVSIAFNSVEGARILAIFPMPSISHQVVFRPLVHELAKRGHEVIVVTPDPVFPKGKAPTNLTEIDVHDISYAYLDKLLFSARGRKEEFMVQFQAIFKIMPLIFEEQLEVPEVKRIIMEERDTIDLVIVESCVRAALGLSHIIKAPMIQISSLGVTTPQYALAGSPMHIFLYPTLLQLRTYNLTLLEKLSEVFTIMTVIYHAYRTEHLDYDLARKYFGDDMPRFESLFSNVKLMLINEHHLWANNRPIAPNIVYIGGIHQTPDKPIPNDLKAYLDSSKNGVIYVSFGSNVKAHLLDNDKIEAMLQVLSDMPYDVLWKWDGDKPPGTSENIKTSKWLPQADLLKHPKVKVFVTQGGLQSTDEAINAAVPLIGMPMFGDQWYNVEKYVQHKIGLGLVFPSLTTDSFRYALNTVLEDPSYKENIIRLRAVMRDHPVRPLDNAVFWVEHLLRHGGDHLQPPTAGIYGVIESCELPLIVTILFILFLMLSVIVFLFILVWRLVKKFIVNKIKTKTQ